MKIVFAGTPEFARIAFEQLVEAGFQVPLVLTQPDRRAGRGMKLVPSPVKQQALACGCEVLQPTSLRLDGRYAQEAQAAREQLLDIAPDVMVVAAYGLILPQWVLDLPARGCLNIHASLLPRWRGAAPIQRAIEAGDTHSGVCIMQMEAGLDTGPVLAREAFEIGQMSAGQLHDQLAHAGGKLLISVLRRLPEALAQAQPQEHSLANYAPKLSKAEAQLDLSEPAALLLRKIRAFNPFPGASLALEGLSEPVKVWEAEALPATAQDNPSAPGTLLAVNRSGIDLQTGEGVLRLTELQKAGGRRQPVASFVQGWPSRTLS